jgi:hypothetical protein
MTIADIVRRGIRAERYRWWLEGMWSLLWGSAEKCWSSSNLFHFYLCPGLSVEEVLSGSAQLTKCFDESIVGPPKYLIYPMGFGLGRVAWPWLADRWRIVEHWIDIF